MRTLKYSFAILLLFFTSLAAAQMKTDSLPGFQDDLLDKLVGTWKVTSVAHEFQSTAKIEAHWVFSHQHLNLHFIGNDVIPWLHVPMEFEYFIGYKHSIKKYVVHGMSVFGDDDYEGFCYAERHGNDLDLMQQNPCSNEKIVLQRFSWNESAKSWTIKSWESDGDKVGEVFLDMKLERVKN